MSFDDLVPVDPDDPAYPGQAIYSPGMLKKYDVLVLGLSNRLLWHCPTARLLNLYDEHVAATHLDVGPGSGYFLDRCRFPVAQPEITLLDLNPNALRFAARRIERYAPRVRQANVLKPFDLGESQFASVGMTYLLHCLPGTMADKAVVFRNLQPVLSRDAVVFGATILGTGVARAPRARRRMRRYNRQGTFSNLHDDVDGLERALSEHFESHQVEVCGVVAVFSAHDARVR